MHFLCSSAPHALAAMSLAAPIFLGEDGPVAPTVDNSAVGMSDTMFFRQPQKT